MVARHVVGRIVNALVRDWRVFSDQVRTALGQEVTPPGLTAYRVRSAAGQVMLHLRIHPDGSGALFVDVADVVHLNRQATEVAHMLLEGDSPAGVVRRLRQRYPRTPADALRADVGRLAAMISALQTPTTGCPTCDLDLLRTPLFSARPYAPYKADLALTYRCNNRCPHCYNDPARRSMVPLEADGWRRVLSKLARIGVPHIIFTGGEPTLCEALPELVRHAHRLGQVTGVNTNGRRLADPGYARHLAAAGLDHVQITLHSHLPEAHDRMVGGEGHAETVAGIRNALAAGLYTMTNTTLTRENQAHALQVVEFVHSLGVTTFAMNGMICAGGGCDNPTALTEQELAVVLPRVRDRARELNLRFLWYTPTEYCRLSPLELELGVRACNAAEYSICIEPNGDVLPCQSYYEVAGNLLRDDWPALWDSPLFRRLRFRREEPAEAGLPPECWECPDLPVCGGGCPLQRVQRLAGARRQEEVVACEA